jgi:hypothetical protein
MQKERDALKHVELEFVGEWMGNSVGTRRSFVMKVADELVRRGVAKTVGKTIDAPPMNKMVESPPVKKSFSRKGV